MASASSTEVLDRFGRQPTSVKVIAFVALLLVFGGLYYYLFFGDMVEEQEALAATRTKLIDDEKKLVKRQGEYQALLEKKKKVERRLGDNAVRLPESSELPAFFAHLETQAATANIRILNRNVEKEIAVESYIKVPVKMMVEGDFYQLNQYFKLLYETPRIISIDQLSIKAKERAADKTRLEAVFVASTFRQADKPAAPPPAPKAPAAPAKPEEKGAELK